ncbi:unnamed protein product [Heligmosomoides polygyrus]|uniref:C2H2-type domain-containing protein n=1 Tax=Heligmosomoides polygyrus TaxID=6339 RepID=A0A3P7ZZE1_HELPZ|nr:unnamed protein product [Heligmosomoides polygyrus]
MHCLSNSGRKVADQSVYGVTRFCTTGQRRLFRAAVCIESTVGPRRDMGRKRVSIGPTSHMDVKLEAMKKPSLIESEAQEGGHEQEVLDGSSDAQETQMDASFNGDSDSHFTDLECLKIYCTLTSWQEFNNALPGIMHENFVRGSMRANGGTLPCFKCHRNFSSPLDIISHLRKCRKRVMKCIAETPVPELAGPHVKRKPVAKRTINFDISVASLDELKHEPSLWLQLTPTEKLDVLKLIFPGRDVECFAIRPSGQKCPTFNDYKRAIAHLDACVQPMYLTYVGERASEFRLLDKKVRARYVREGMAMCVQLPCIECGRLFTHHYGLLYHVERCNVSVDEMPWKCYRCGFQTKRSKSQEHLRDCWGSEREQQDAPQEPATPVMGTLGDVNLRSGKAILKEVDGVIEIGGVKKMVNEINAEEAIKSILGSNKSILTPRRRRSAGGGRASVSAGVIPETSTRLTVSGDGKMRFKFRKADAKAGVAGMSGYPRYLEQVQKSHELWREEVTALPYCSRLSDIQPAVWEATSNSSELPFASKESVGLRVHEEWDVEHIDVPQSCRRIRCLSSTELFNETNESVTVAYCGGPINAIRVAPNTMSNGDDVVAVVTYPCEITLVGKDMRSADGFVQLDTTTIPQKSPESTIVPVTAEPTYPPPVHNLTWTSRDAAQYVVGVNAAGGAVIWDLQRSVDTPQVLLDPTWSSPVTYAVFVGEHEGKESGYWYLRDPL